jgi:hypothetical protein
MEHIHNNLMKLGRYMYSTFHMYFELIYFGLRVHLQEYKCKGWVLQIQESQTVPFLLNFPKTRIRTSRRIEVLPDRRGTFPTEVPETSAPEQELFVLARHLKGEEEIPSQIRTRRGREKGAA